MSKTIGPITLMLIDPDHSKEIRKQMEESAKEYFSSRNSMNLINDIK